MVRMYGYVMEPMVEFLLLSVKQAVLMDNVPSLVQEVPIPEITTITDEVVVQQQGMVKQVLFLSTKCVVMPMVVSVIM